MACNGLIVVISGLACSEQILIGSFVAFGGVCRLLVVQIFQRSKVSITAMTQGALQGSLL